MRTLLTFLMIALTAAVTNNFVLAENPVAHAGGTVRVAITSDIRSTNAGVRRDGNTDAVLYHIGEALVAFKKDLSPAPMLAEKIRISEDGKRYHFSLRRGVKFHNGVEMTSADVVWSWQRLLDAKTGYRCKADFDGTGPYKLRITDITTSGPYDVTFHLNKRSSLFLDRMASIQCLTAIIHKSSVASDGSWIAPIATGPYKLEEWKKGQYVALSRFDDYASRENAADGLTGKKTAYFDKIIFQVVPDRIAAKASVYAGNIDVVFALPLSSAKEVKRRAATRGDIKVYHHDTLDWTVLLMQNRDPLFKDKRMRRAIAHAISQDLITTFSTFGHAPANASAIPTLSPFHQKLPQNWPEYNPEKARALAAEAGYKGEEIILQANRKYIYMFDNAVAIQAMLQAAGFNARIEVYDWASQLTNFFKGRFQLSSFGYSARNHPALVFGNIIGNKETRASAQWESPVAVALSAELEAATTQAQVQLSVNKLHSHMVDEMPIIGLYNDHIMDITPIDIKGYQPWAFGRPRLWNVWRKGHATHRTQSSHKEASP
ncbi:MAG: hypothetical protein KUG56_03170 [Kordiimonadaceae bacterium]|nr:hypothetical protein [Kordiimonadaceae bacterium]